MWKGSAHSVWELKVATMCESGERMSFCWEHGKGMCLGGIRRHSRGVLEGR